MDIDKQITIITNHFVRMIIKNDPFIFQSTKIYFFDDSENGMSLRMLQKDDPEVRKATTSFDFPKLDIRDDQLDIAIELAGYISVKLHDYYKHKNKSSKGGKKSSAKLTPKQRSERAKKAVAARMAKYGQKSRKTKLQ